MHRFLVFALLFTACSKDLFWAAPDPLAPGDACEDCLASGGTWQPEIDECTEDCAVQDISCFTDECPGDCTDDCAFCFDQTTCEAAECQWNEQDEAAWCTTPV